MDDQYGRASLRPETVLNDFNSMYFLNVERKRFSKKQKDEEDDDLNNLNWEVTPAEKYEDFVEFSKEVHQSSKFFGFLFLTGFGVRGDLLFD